MKIQKVIRVERLDGEYYNFFNSPGSINSLSRLVNELCWTVKFIKDDPEKEVAILILEREENDEDLPECYSYCHIGARIVSKEQYESYPEFKALNWNTKWPNGHPEPTWLFFKMFFCKHDWTERVGENFKDVVCPKCGSWSHWINK